MPLDPPADDPDDRPRPRRGDDRSPDDDRPRRRRPPPPPPEAPTNVGRILLIVFGGIFVCLVGCCGGGIGLMYYFSGRQVEKLDASRDKTPADGTSRVSVTVRVGGDTPGGFVRGDYYFMFKAGSRQSVHGVGLIGRGSGEFRSSFATPELVDQPGPVEFWVERRERDSVHKVSPTYTIP